MLSRVRQVLTRIRAVYRSIRAIGLPATVQLFRRRVAAAFGQTSRTLYTIKVPGYKHPVTIRGGNGSDGFALYQIHVMRDFDVLADLGSPRLIIDAGANIGMTSIYFLNRYPSVRIVAVEPNPETFEICRRNLAPFSDRVVLLKGAVWSRCGRVLLEHGPVEWNSHVRDAGASEEASVISFDVPYLIAQGGGGPVDLLKVDIEGGEAEVFGIGAEQWISSIKNIIIEFHGDICEKTFFKALEGYQYDGFSFRTQMICENIRNAGPFLAHPMQHLATQDRTERPCL
jgi:FkbM family methyltransferase